MTSARAPVTRQVARTQLRPRRTMKVAITAIMGKLLLLANALIAQDRAWTATPPMCA